MICAQFNNPEEKEILETELKIVNIFMHCGFVWQNTV